MPNNVRVPEEIAGTSFPCFAIDGSTDPKARTDTERLQWINDRVEEGRGAIEFGMTDGGHIGVWLNTYSVAIGTGDTASDAIDDAIDSAARRDAARKAAR